MRHKFKWEEITGAGLLLISMFMILISVFLCFSNDIWYDELFTMGLGNQSFRDLVSITALDVHPPLYYGIIKLALMIFDWGESGLSQVMIAKLVSVLPFFLCFVYAVTKIRKNFGLLTAGISMILILSMPQLPFYTVEIRMYGFTLFFILAGMLHAYEITVNKEFRTRPCVLSNGTADGGNHVNNVLDTSKYKYYVNWICLTLYSIAACYTHYFACVAAVMIYVYLFVQICFSHHFKHNLLPFICSGGVCAAGYLPWIISAVTRQVGQVRADYWIQPLTVKSIGGCVKFLFKPSFKSDAFNLVLAVLMFGIVTVTIIYTLMSLIKKRLADKTVTGIFALGCVFILLGTTAFGFLSSILIRPVFVYRYMLPAMGVFWLSFAIMLSYFKNKKLIFLSVLILFSIVGIRNYRAFYGEEMWKRVQMETAADALLQVGSSDKVLYNFDQAQAVISYYIPNQSYLWAGEPEALIRRMYPQNEALIQETFTDEDGMKRIKDWVEANETVWYLGSGNVREEILEKWKAQGINAEEKADVMIEKYWFKIYLLGKDS